ncbi:MAG: sodium:proton antiporter [Methanocorpusculum sp.]|uniref:Sodium:proton antiporter n=1 Tax=Methanocorpusculum petauri TaxID=3002863 RepID=A0ABT4II80_9EURY|nr:sodium:proton antiporter [Methanocorpusculum petauri]MCZ9311911.1 sodium:proton antiporter [Methanocorpusculum sp.]MCZ0861457.1 sodium:proton antiporter [Methanocorpusculum petauri]MDE2443841.1 sodium:proton antiporter [Methanocorpusculum sp.]MDE2519302.1 sodium:proton antiporter [Methanocorpusculum sp.]MDE2521977.1 sodium:proton antiporter [Methanocorpusculum sp.]
MIANLPFIAVALLIGIAFAMILLKRNMIKMIMGLGILEGAVNLFLVSLGYREDGIAPIFTGAPADAAMVMPTVQALTLTNIVIGVATTALMLVFVMLIYKKYGTVNANEMRRLKE